MFLMVILCICILCMGMCMCGVCWVRVYFVWYPEFPHYVDVCESRYGVL